MSPGETKMAFNERWYADEKSYKQALKKSQQKQPIKTLIDLLMIAPVVVIILFFCMITPPIVIYFFFCLICIAVAYVIIAMSRWLKKSQPLRSIPRRSKDNLNDTIITGLAIAAAVVWIPIIMLFMLFTV